ncbi:hypothetical protein CsSME_00023477 [Camellia sinensis var. sinensis]
MQGGIQKLMSHGKNAVLQHIRLVNPVMRPLLFPRYESVAASSRMEEHGFESTTISDILKGKGKSADGSWLWCTTDDTVYEAMKSMHTTHPAQTYIDTRVRGGEDLRQPGQSWPSLSLSRPMHTTHPAQTHIDTRVRGGEDTHPHTALSLSLFSRDQNLSLSMAPLS